LHDVLLAAANHKYATIRPHVNHACAKYAFNGTNVFKNTSDNHWKRLFEGSSYRSPLPNIPRAGPAGPRGLPALTQPTPSGIR
jgi:hypothetical protein